MAAPTRFDLHETHLVEPRVRRLIVCMLPYRTPELTLARLPSHTLLGSYSRLNIALGLPAAGRYWKQCTTGLIP